MALFRRTLWFRLLSVFLVGAFVVFWCREAAHVRFVRDLDGWLGKVEGEKTSNEVVERGPRRLLPPVTSPQVFSGIEDAERLLSTSQERLARDPETGDFLAPKSPALYRIVIAGLGRLAGEAFGKTSEEGISEAVLVVDLAPILAGAGVLMLAFRGQRGSGFCLVAGWLGFLPFAVGRHPGAVSGLSWTYFWMVCLCQGLWVQEGQMPSRRRRALSLFAAGILLADSRATLNSCAVLLFFLLAGVQEGAGFLKNARTIPSLVLVAFGFGCEFGAGYFVFREGSLISQPVFLWMGISALLVGRELSQKQTTSLVRFFGDRPCAAKCLWAFPIACVLLYQIFNYELLSESAAWGTDVTFSFSGLKLASAFVAWLALGLLWLSSLSYVIGAGMRAFKQGFLGSWLVGGVPTLVCLGCVAWLGTGWGLVALLALGGVVAVPSGRNLLENVGIVCFGGAAIVGAWCSLKPTWGTTVSELSAAEAESVVSRELAFWLHRRATEAERVLAPPRLSEVLAFNGRVGVYLEPSLRPESRYPTVLKLCSGNRLEEMAEVLESRGITRIVLPSWDASLDHFAAAGRFGAQGGREAPESSLIARLKRWEAPVWLTPIAFPIPQVSGLENVRVVIWERAPRQTELQAFCRLAEYFCEADMRVEASAAAKVLEEVPLSLDALLSRVRVAMYVGDVAVVRELLPKVRVQVASGAGISLPSDRRALLISTLFRLHEEALARAEYVPWEREITEASLRRCSPRVLAELLAEANKRTLVWSRPSVKHFAEYLSRGF